MLRCQKVLGSSAPLLLLMLVHVVSPAATGAQDSSRSVVRVLVGRVVDQDRMPVAGAEVFLEPRRLHAVTSADGSFEFRGLHEGTEALTVRRLGYQPLTRPLSIDTGTTEIRVTLKRLAFSLPPIETVAPRSGISGLVLNGSDVVIATAEVRVVPSGEVAKSDSSGEFFVPLTAGDYMIRVRAPGYAPRLMSVTVRADSTRRLLVRMAAGNVSPARVEAAVEGFRQRMLRRKLAWSRYFTSDEIAAHGWNVYQMAAIGAGRLPGIGCEASLDGERERVRLRDIAIEEVEAVEVYTTRTAASKAYRQGSDFCPNVIVWRRPQ